MRVMFLGLLLIFIGIGCLAGQIYYNWLSHIINRESLGEVSYSYIASILSYVSLAVTLAGLTLLPMSLRPMSKKNLLLRSKTDPTETLS